MERRMPIEDMNAFMAAKVCANMFHCDVADAFPTSPS